MSDAELRDPIKIINLAKETIPTPKPWRDPILVYGVSLLVVAALSFYGGFKWGIDHKNATIAQTWVAVGRACVEHVTSLQPRKVKLEAPIWIARNCEQIADRSLERISGMRTGMVR